MILANCLLKLLTGQVIYDFTFPSGGLCFVDLSSSRIMIWCVWWKFIDFPMCLSVDTHIMNVDLCRFMYILCQQWVLALSYLWLIFLLKYQSGYSVLTELMWIALHYYYYFILLFVSWQFILANKIHKWSQINEFLMAGCQYKVQQYLLEWKIWSCNNQRTWCFV